MNIMPKRLDSMIKLRPLKRLLRSLVIAFLLMLAVVVGLLTQLMFAVPKSHHRKRKIAANFFVQPEYLIPTSASNFTSFSRSRCVPLTHTGYLKPDIDTALMVARTSRRQQEYVDIRVEKSLREVFGQGNANAACRVSYADLPNATAATEDRVAEEADVYVTREIRGIQVNNAALHFTQVAYMPGAVAKTNCAERWWWGTDIVASANPVQDYLEYDGMLTAPMHIPVFQSVETNSSFLQDVDWQAKQNFLLIIVHPGQLNSSIVNEKLIAFLEDYRGDAVVFPTHLSSGKEPALATTKCKHSLMCYIKIAKACVIADFSTTGEIVQDHLWRALALGTRTIYISEQNLNDHTPPNLALRVPELLFTSEILLFLRQDSKVAFRWKDTKYQDIQEQTF